MTLSYAQRLEDYHLSRAFGDQRSGFYVDIGGGHPVADNVSYWFYLRGWSGLIVEPQEALCRRYRRLRPRDVAVCSLVGRHNGEADFHAVDTLHGLSTTLEQHARKAAELGATYTTSRRPVMTLARLLETHGVERIDFLKVDVEGAEADVFAGADWTQWRPRIIVAEAIAPNATHDVSAEWEGMLIGQNYISALFDGLNRFYVAAEETALLERLPREPAPWDVVPHLYEFGYAPDNPHHPDHALAIHLAAAFLSGLSEESDESLAALLLKGSNDARAARRLQRILGAAGSDSGGSTEERCRALVRNPAFRAALGRIAAPYDGGLMLDDDPGDDG